MNAASLINYLIKKNIITLTMKEKQNLCSKIGSDVILGIDQKNLVLAYKNKIKKGAHRTGTRHFGHHGKVHWDINSGGMVSGSSIYVENPIISRHCTWWIWYDFVKRW